LLFFLSYHSYNMSRSEDKPAKGVKDTKYKEEDNCPGMPGLNAQSPMDGP
jgi:hypothetical protein